MMEYISDSDIKFTSRPAFSKLRNKRKILYLHNIETKELTVNRQKFPMSICNDHIQSGFEYL